MEGGVKYVDAGRARKFGNKSPFAIIRLEIQGSWKLVCPQVHFVDCCELSGKNYFLKPPFCSEVESLWQIFLTAC